MPPPAAMANHRMPVPPTNMSTAPMPKSSSVPDRCGSSSMSTASTPRMTAKGSTPTENCFMRVWLREMMWLNTRMTANLAISLGCRVPTGSTIHRLQPLYSGMKSTTTSSTTERPSTGQASLW